MLGSPSLGLPIAGCPEAGTNLGTPRRLGGARWINLSRKGNRGPSGPLFTMWNDATCESAPLSWSKRMDSKTGLAQERP